MGLCIFNVLTIMNLGYFKRIKNKILFLNTIHFWIIFKGEWKTQIWFKDHRITCFISSSTNDISQLKLKSNFTQRFSSVKNPDFGHWHCSSKNNDTKSALLNNTALDSPPVPVTDICLSSFSTYIENEIISLVTL